MDITLMLVELPLNEDLDVFRIIFLAVLDLANFEMNILGFKFTPLDFWVFTALMYMIVDMLLWYIGIDGDGKYD